MELSGERYILERSQEGWLIREDHYWTMSRGTMSHAYAMDGAFWASMDQRVEGTRSI